MNNTGICIFGDSITWGKWDLEKGGWANRLRIFIDEKINMPKLDYFETYNLGVSGDTTEDLLKRFEIEAAAREPKMIIFSIGVNDSAYLKSENKNRVPFDKLEVNIQKLTQLAKKFTEKVVFIGLSKVDENKTNPIPWRPDIYYTNENIKKYDDKLKNICIENSIPYLDTFNLLDKEELEDGLHPNSKGHEKTFQKIKEFLIKHNLLPSNA